MILHRMFVLGLVVAALGCSYDDDDDDDWHHHDDDDGEPVPIDPGPGVARAGIDADATLADVEPGFGTGAFIEYRSTGAWRVFTSCDSELSGFSCLWDILVTPHDAPLHSVNVEGLEHNDIGGFQESSGHLIADNDFDLDGMVVQTDPGATVRVDVFLDGEPSERYVYWVENGGLHRGAPTNPVDLVPNAP